MTTVWAVADALAPNTWVVQAQPQPRFSKRSSKSSERRDKSADLSPPEHDHHHQTLTLAGRTREEPSSVYDRNVIDSSIRFRGTF